MNMNVKEVKSNIEMDIKKEIINIILNTIVEKSYLLKSMNDMDLFRKYLNECDNETLNKYMFYMHKIGCKVFISILYKNIKDIDE